MDSFPECFSLAGRVAFIGGATQGIGRACAIALAQAGASVILAGRNDEGLAKALNELPCKAGQKHGTSCVDYASWTAVQQAADAIAASRTIHILIHNTGGPAAGFAVDANPTDYAKAFEMHLLSGQALVRAFAPGMRAAGYGRIVNIASTSVVTPIKGLGVSNTIRAAVANWSRSLASELAPFGITSNTVLPGYTATARLASLFKGKADRAGSTEEQITRDAVATIPAGRLGEAEEIAAAVLFLSSPAASYVNGVNLPVDGGRLAGN
ncbi:MAG: SDR family oxidoreductase [Planctomycetota bacterium]|nr:SDR family oxidoreductase [Planctomycetota bacterium]